MTDAELKSISRSFAGHIATSPPVRKELNEALTKGEDPKIEALIKAHVGGTLTFVPGDIAKIKQHIRDFFGVKGAPNIDGPTILNFNEP